jgi:hypothetical protein
MMKERVLTCKLSNDYQHEENFAELNSPIYTHEVGDDVEG